MIEAGFEVDEIIVDFLEVDGMECNEWADPVHTMMTLGGKGANVDLGEGSRVSRTVELWFSDAAHTVLDLVWSSIGVQFLQSDSFVVMGLRVLF